MSWRGEGCDVGCVNFYSHFLVGACATTPAQYWFSHPACYGVCDVISLLNSYKRLQQYNSISIKLLAAHDIITQESTATNKQAVALLHDSSTLKLQSIQTSLNSFHRKCFTLFVEHATLNVSYKDIYYFSLKMLKIFAFTIKRYYQK